MTVITGKGIFLELGWRLLVSSPKVTAIFIYSSVCDDDNSIRDEAPQHCPPEIQQEFDRRKIISHMRSLVCRAICGKQLFLYYVHMEERERDSRVPSIVSNDVSYANLSPSSSFLHCSHLLQSQHFDANLESFDVFVVIKVISLQRKRTL